MGSETAQEFFVIDCFPITGFNPAEQCGVYRLVSAEQCICIEFLTLFSFCYSTYFSSFE